MAAYPQAAAHRVALQPHTLHPALEAVLLRLSDVLVERPYLQEIERPFGILGEGRLELLLQLRPNGGLVLSRLRNPHGRKGWRTVSPPSLPEARKGSEA